MTILPAPRPATSSPGSARTSIARIVEEHGRARVARPRRPVRRLRGHDPQGPRRPRGRSAALVRTHGGAIAVDRGRPELAFDIRERLQADEKDAHRARRRPRSSSTARASCMDASTTALSVARQLKARGGWSQLTVITNGLRIASELAGPPRDHASLMLGGPRPLGGAVGRRPARRRPVRAGSTSRRRSSAPPGSRSSRASRTRPTRRRRSSARWSRARPRGHRASSTTRSGSARRSRPSARPTGSTSSSPTTAAPAGDGRRRSTARGVDVRLVGRPGRARGGDRRRAARGPADDGRRGAVAQPAAEPAVAVAPRVAAARHLEAVRRRPRRCDDVSLDAAAGRGPRARRRERRRQEHAGQDPGRRPPARQRRRSGSTASRPTSRARPRPARSGSPSSTRSRACSRT